MPERHRSSFAQALLNIRKGSTGAFPFWGMRERGKNGCISSSLAPASRRQHHQAGTPHACVLETCVCPGDRQLQTGQYSLWSTRHSLRNEKGCLTQCRNGTGCRVRGPVCVTLVSHSASSLCLLYMWTVLIMTACVLPRIRMGSDEAVHASVLSKPKFSVNASLRCGRMFYDCKLAGLSSATRAEASNSTENISHCDQTSIFLSVATGNEGQCFTATGQITCDDIYQLSELQINHLSLFLFLQNKLRSETIVSGC